METMNEQAQTPITESSQPLASLKTKELHERYAALFGVPTHSRNRPYLIRRITAKLEGHEDEGNALHVVMGDGDHVEIVEPIADQAISAADPSTSESTDVAEPPLDKPRDPRLPPPGTILTKNFKNSEYQVTVLENTFEFEGETYTSLSTIAKRITGCAWNGYIFWALGKRNSEHPHPRDVPTEENELQLENAIYPLPSLIRGDAAQQFRTAR